MSGRFEDDFALRPVCGPLVTVVRGVHWLVTLGEPPHVLAVCQDVTVAERIHELLVEHGLLEVPNTVDAGAEG